MKYLILFLSIFTSTCFAAGGADLDASIANHESRLIALESGGGGGSGAVSSFGFSGIQGLKIACRANATTYEISFKAVILKNATGDLLSLPANSMVLDVAASGVNGLDTGSLGVAWYNIFIISDGTLSRSVMSLSNTPTLPSGYTYWVYAGPAQVYDASPIDLNQSLQYGNHVTAQDRGAMPSTGVAANAVTTYQSLNLSNYVPPNATHVSGFMGAKSGSRKMMAIATWTSSGSFVGDVGRLNAHGPAWTVTAGFDGFGPTDNFSDLAIENQTLYWKSGDTQAANILYISSYKIDPL